MSKNIFFNKLVKEAKLVKLVDIYLCMS